MNKDDFISLIATQNNITKVEAKGVVDKFTSAIITGLKQGDEISLIGFGNFVIQEIPERKGRNPRTGKDLTVPAYKQVRFKVGKFIKEAVNA